jgi:hypothetical protein
LLSSTVPIMAAIVDLIRFALHFAEVTPCQY